ncbi:MAG: hypothetical protein ACK5H1_10475 [Tenacibaculum sp.]
MECDFYQLKNCLYELSSNSSPKWGFMSANQMLYHCNTFIEISLGTKKVSLTYRVLGKIFGKLFLRYLKSIDFDILKFKKNAKTLKVFIRFPTNIDFNSEKDSLLMHFNTLQKMNSKTIKHQLYGKIPTHLFKKLMYFHTSYHFYQFGVFDF